MADLQAVQQKIQDLHDAITAEKQEVGAKLDELGTTIQQLRDQIAAGNTEPADLDQIASALDSVKADIQGIIETPAPPPPVITDGGSDNIS